MRKQNVCFLVGGFSNIFEKNCYIKKIGRKFREIFFL